jgi:hypothetical protein
LSGSAGFPALSANQLEDIGNFRAIEMRFKQGVRLPEPAGVTP